MARMSAFSSLRLPMLGAAAALALAVAGCTTPPPVPPLRAETQPLPPVSAQTLVWQPGDWNWTGQDYTWQPGRYVEASVAGMQHQWVPGHWGQDRPSAPWQWIPGHWM